MTYKAASELVAGDVLVYGDGSRRPVLFVYTDQRGNVRLITEGTGCSYLPHTLFGVEDEDAVRPIVRVVSVRVVGPAALEGPEQEADNPMTNRKTADQIEVGDVILTHGNYRRFPVEYVYPSPQGIVYLRFNERIDPFLPSHVFDVEPKHETWRDRPSQL